MGGNIGFTMVPASKTSTGRKASTFLQLLIKKTRFDGGSTWLLRNSINSLPEDTAGSAGKKRSFFSNLVQGSIRLFDSGGVRIVMEMAASGSIFSFKAKSSNISAASK